MNLWAASNFNILKNMQCPTFGVGMENIKVFQIHDLGDRVIIYSSSATIVNLWKDRVSTTFSVSYCLNQMFLSILLQLLSSYSWIHGEKKSFFHDHPWTYLTLCNIYEPELCEFVATERHSFHSTTDLQILKRMGTRSLMCRLSQVILVNHCTKVHKLNSCFYSLTVAFFDPIY